MAGYLKRKEDPNDRYYVFTEELAARGDMYPFDPDSVKDQPAGGQNIPAGEFYAVHTAFGRFDVMKDGEVIESNVTGKAAAAERVDALNAPKASDDATV